VKDIFDVAKHK